ncbi:hypothetical protein ACFL23_04475, partial [Patescibacteria group bacterium]
MGVRIAEAQEGVGGTTKKVLNVVGDGVNQLVGHVVQLFVWVGGQLLAVLMYLLFVVAKYNNFIDAPAVATGWFIVRDLCNIFFIVIFLVMTVGTVLGIENYHYSRILTKLLIMTVLINFSKMICGLFIDVSQVIMLTFINNFGKLGAGYLTKILGIQDLLGALKGNAAQTTEISFATMAASYILVLIYVIVALATILVLLLVLVQRMVMLWIYVVLSPLAYLLSTFPGGANYASKWWSEFIKYVTIGPIIAFFLWLSFVSLSKTATFTDLTTGKSFEDLSPQEKAMNLSKDTPQAGITVAGSTDHMIKFIIAIAMLLGGLMVAQTIGGMAGNFAGNTINTLQEGAVGATDWVNRLQSRGLTGKGFKTEEMTGVKKAGGMLANVVLRGTGQDLNVKRKWGDIKGGFEKKKKEDITAMYARAGSLSKAGGLTGLAGSFGTKDFVDQKLRGLFWRKGIQEAVATSALARPFGGGPTKKDKKKEDDGKKELERLNKKREKIITQDEYDNKLVSFNDQEKQIVANISKNKKDSKDTDT